MFFLLLLLDSCGDVNGELLIVNQYNGKLLQGFAVMKRSSWHRIELVEKKNQIIFEHLYYHVYVKQCVSCSAVSSSLCKDCNPPVSSVHGVLQARIMEWVAILFSRGSSQPRIEPRSPTLALSNLQLR